MYLREGEETLTGPGDSPEFGDMMLGQNNEKI